MKQNQTERLDRYKRRSKKVKQKLFQQEWKAQHNKLRGTPLKSSDWLSERIRIENEKMQYDDQA
jgi:hypothetical protein